MNDLFPTPGYGTEFERFWALYPRKHGTSKVVANKAWIRARRKASCADIMAGLEAYPFSHEAHLQPHPATWLNGARWQQHEDTPAPSKVVPEANQRPSKTAWMEGYENPGRWIEADPA